MNYRNDPYAGGFQRPHGGQQQQFPGIANPVYNGNYMPPPSTTPRALTPTSADAPGFNSALEFNPVPSPALPPVPVVGAEVATPPAPKSSGFSLSSIGGNIKDLQGLVERMGGLDGIITTMTKVQKVVGSVQQMAPLIKVLAGSFGKKSDSASSDDDIEEYVPKRRRRRRTGSSGRRRRVGSGTNGSRKRRPRR